MKVVIIDDSSKVRAELRQIVARQGWEVVAEGETGREAIDLVCQLQPDLLTLDIIMPEMDGIECYRRLRSLKVNTRCLLVSVLAAEPRIVQAFKHEIRERHFLKKPIVEKDFKERIDELFKCAPFAAPDVQPAMEEPQLLAHS